MLPIVYAGVITEAPTISQVLGKLMVFLLSIVGVLGIIGLVISGILYFWAAGNPSRIRVAKAATMMSLVGIVLALGSMVLLTALQQFFS